MPVSIDEVSAEIAPPTGEARAIAPAPEATPAREQLLRRQREQAEHLTQRTERVRAD